MEPQVKRYTCPMHPQIVQDKPGNCPICGMTLVLAKTDHNKDHGAHHHPGTNPPMAQIGILPGLISILVIAIFKKLGEPTVYGMVLSGIGFFMRDLPGRARKL